MQIGNLACMGFFFAGRPGSVRSDPGAEAP